MKVVRSQAVKTVSLDALMEGKCFTIPAETKFGEAVSIYLCGKTKEVHRGFAKEDGVMVQITRLSDGHHAWRPWDTQVEPVNAYVVVEGK